MADKKKPLAPRGGVSKETIWNWLAVICAVYVSLCLSHRIPANPVTVILALVALVIALGRLGTLFAAYYKKN